MCVPSARAASCTLQRFGQRRRKLRIDKHRNRGGIAYKLASKLQPLRPHFRSHSSRAREIAPQRYSIVTFLPSK
jgi:hypothetical protein